jgi:hypothetical protein
MLNCCPNCVFESRCLKWADRRCTDYQAKPCGGSSSATAHAPPPDTVSIRSLRTDLSRHAFTRRLALAC